MDQVSFGVFDWIDRGSEPVYRLYQERLRLLEAADEAGFFCYHLAEHHATPLGMAPSPALFLSAAAQHTRQIRLGPLVYLLPLYDPLRLIEEVAMLDQLSGGRLELGVGRGVSPYELRNFGAPMAQVDPPAAHDTADRDTTTDHRPPCPCCGGRMIILEVFARGAAPGGPPSDAGIQT